MTSPSVRLRRAIREGSLPIVKRLLRRYPWLLVNYDPENGWSSLHYAGYYGHYLICVYLVGQGHDKDEISLDHHRNTPLHLAALMNHEQTVHFLAQHIPRCMDWVNDKHETAVMAAARRGNDPCINLLLDFGANVNIADREGNTPVHVAAAYGHIKTLRTLVERSANTAQANDEGWRPVQYCSTYQVQDYLQSLIHAVSTKKDKLPAPPPRLSAPITLAASSSSSSTSLGSGSNNSSNVSIALAAKKDKPLPPVQPQSSQTSPRSRVLDVSIRGR
ncbi:hypothetical protein TRVA0_027S01442 [Trichomonascus vanleenenianus]|uniref:Avo2p n=1 Tax=Trichomonascus vanleenenianus TaxID=2268995 RepID=UPI003ECB7266